MPFAGPSIFGAQARRIQLYSAEHFCEMLIINDDVTARKAEGQYQYILRLASQPSSCMHNSGPNTGSEPGLSPCAWCTHRAQVRAGSVHTMDNEVPDSSPTWPGPRTNNLRLG